jgi:hypothetical protein
MLYNKCMEGQYGKGDPLSFDVYKACPQLKAPFIKLEYSPQLQAELQNLKTLLLLEI